MPEKQRKNPEKPKKASTKKSADSQKPLIKPEKKNQTKKEKLSAEDKNEETVRLKKELVRLSKDMVYEDIRFLVAQANLLIRNRETESLEREMAESYRELSQSSSEPRPDSGAGASNRPLAIQLVKSGSGNANLVVNGQFKLLVPEELAAMAKIAIAEAGEDEKLDRLARWLDRERRDILFDLGMGGKRSPKLRQLLCYFEQTFSKRKTST